MNALYVQKLIIAISLLSLSGCATVHRIVDSTGNKGASKVVANTKESYEPTDPYLVKINPDKKLIAHHYKVIGRVDVNQVNLAGIKRQYGVITDLIKEQASKIGGDAVLDIKKLANGIYEGQVIRYTNQTA